MSTDILEWAFSGIGVTLFLLIIQLIWNYMSRRFFSPKPPTIPGDFKSTDTAGDNYISCLEGQLKLYKGLDLGKNLELKQMYIERRISVPNLSKGVVKNVTHSTEKKVFDRVVNGDDLRVLVEGPAGIGKTSLISRWALWMIENNNNSTEKLVPIFFSLRNIADECNKDRYGATIVQIAGKRYPTADGNISQMLTKYLTDSVKSGKVCIFLDGLDEVSKELRPAVKDWLELLDNYATRCPIVITSRPSINLDLPGYKNVKVDPLDDGHRKAFISKWFRRVKDRPNLDDYPLLNITVTAGNPLFLTMMCINYEANGQVPATQGKLIEEFVRILLKRWDRNRGILREDRDDKIPLDLELKVLESIAYYFFEKHQLTFTDRELYTHIDKLLKKIDDNVIKAPEIVEEISQSSGILISDNMGNYRFCHQIFFEYFTARKIFWDTNIDKNWWIADKSYDEQYQNVVALFMDILRT